LIHREATLLSDRSKIFFGGNQNLVNLEMKLTTSKHIFFRGSNIEKLEKHNFDSKEAYAWHGI
jgi:hypothetical protein